MTTPTGENVAIEARLAVLETQMEVVQDGQRQIISRLDAMQQSNDAKFDAIQRQFDSMQNRFDVAQERNEARFDTLQQRSDARFDAIQQRSEARFDITTNRYDALNSRIDRLFYTMLGLGVAAIGTLIALEKFL